VTRLRRIADRDRIFFVKANLHRRAPRLSGAERDLLLNQLGRQHAANQFLIFAYVIMPTHFHLLIAPRNVGLVAMIREFKSRTATELAKMRSSRSPVWQARYFDFILRRVGDFWDKLEYIHQNPVEATLAETPEGWSWSSAAHYVHAGPVAVPIDPIDLPSERRAWLRAPWGPL
jgi:putative transposase